MSRVERSEQPGKRLVCSYLKRNLLNGRCLLE